MVAIALLMSVLAFVTSHTVGVPLRDPDGFLGPSWTRLPALVLIAFGLDVVPRSMWRARGRVRSFRREATLLISEHWTRERIVLVLVGISSFYATYVSYRNLKSLLPYVRTIKYDYALHDVDRALLFGHDPAMALHTLLGSGVAAHVLSIVYLSFLPMVPLSVIIWLVWSRNVSFGYWFATSTCLTWALGTASYYLLPTLGPAFFFPWVYADLDSTGVTTLQKALDVDRKSVMWNPLADTVQSVAGFASLHVALTLLIALTLQYTVRTLWVRRTGWVFFALTVVSTLYFGWHYIADDLAGAAMAGLAFYLGAVATGQKFDRRGRSSHPTTTTASVPVD